MTLINELARQRQAVAEFRGAIAAIAVQNTPDGFEPVQTEPLAVLRELMASAADEAQRGQRLEQATAALKTAEAALEKLETGYKASLTEAEAAAEKLRSLSSDFNDEVARFQAAIAEKLAEMQAIAGEANQAYRDVGWEPGFKRSQFFEPKWADNLPVALLASDRQIVLSRLEVERLFVERRLQQQQQQA